MDTEKRVKEIREFEQARTLRKIARVIVTAQQIREDSWNGKRYKHGLHDAAGIAIPDEPQVAQLVYLLTALAWNDAQDWAEEVLRA
jgi:hypothetical protein